MKHVDIFTDGACSGNPGPGGWGAVLRYGETEKELSGGEADTTNNRMELLAAISALNALKSPCEVDLDKGGQRQPTEATFGQYRLVKRQSKATALDVFQGQQMRLKVVGVGGIQWRNFKDDPVRRHQLKVSAGQCVVGAVDENELAFHQHLALGM